VTRRSAIGDLGREQRCSAAFLAAGAPPLTKSLALINLPASRGMFEGRWQIAIQGDSTSPALAFEPLPPSPLSGRSAAHSTTATSSGIRLAALLGGGGSVAGSRHHQHQLKASAPSAAETARS